MFAVNHVFPGQGRGMQPSHQEECKTFGLTAYLLFNSLTPMNSIYAITTYHTPEGAPDAAEAWREERVCAIGYSGENNEELHPAAELFRQIGQGDLILAYSRRNRIAYVGEIKDRKPLPIETAKMNLVGRDESDGGFGYENQRNVTWYGKPHHFSRLCLPPPLSNQLGKRGKTVVQIELKGKSFREVKDIIMTSAKWMPQPKWMPEGT
jgi:hypothetical protein